LAQSSFLYKFFIFLKILLLHCLYPNRYPATNHPDYNTIFPPTNYYKTHTANTYVHHQHHGHTRRPYTVASYQPETYGSFPNLSEGRSRPQSGQNSVVSGSDRSANSRPSLGSNSALASPASVHGLQSNYSAADRYSGSQSYHSSGRKASSSSRSSQQRLKKFGVTPSATHTTDYSQGSYRSSPSKPDY
jgi:hypothetical protein